MKKLNLLLTKLIKTDNDKQISGLISEISESLKNINFGMDNESENLTKRDILSDLEKYKQNPFDKTNLKIRIFFLTKLIQ